MSLVTTIKSQRSRIALHNISTSVVLPEPTGPPTPTRSGGRRLLRPAIECRAVVIVMIERGASIEFRAAPTEWPASVRTPDVARAAAPARHRPRRATRQPAHRAAVGQRSVRAALP